MEDKKIEVCRLCLHIKTDKNYVCLENWKEMLETVFPKIVNISENTNICDICCENLVFCHKFKRKVLENGSYRNCIIKSEMSNDHFQGNLESIDIKSEINELCSLCLDNRDANLETDSVYLKTMLETCFSEFTKDAVCPISCRRCLEDLEKSFVFITSCLESEGKIQEFCAVNEKKVSEELNLFEVAQYISNWKNTNIDLGVLNNTLYDNEITVKEELNLEGDGNAIVEKNESYPSEDASEATPQLETAALLVKDKKYNCDYCPFVASHMWKLKRHIIIHKDPSEVHMFRCDLCPFETKHRFHLSRHVLNHKPPSETFKCDMCPYESHVKENFNRHHLVHREPMYKCELCAYGTCRKSSFDKHKLTHKNLSEITMYNCDKCNFKTKYKVSIQRHSILHKQPFEIAMFKCARCSFETKRKSSLQSHVKLHMGPQELEMYNCRRCQYATRYKNAFDEHVVIHKHSSEVVMHKCDICNYETKKKRCLAQHMLIHKSPSEVPMYKCEECSFETKYKSYIKKHARNHKERAAKEVECR